MDNILSISQAIRKELDALSTITPQYQQDKRKLEQKVKDARKYAKKKESRRKKMFPFFADAMERNLVLNFDDKTVKKCLQLELELCKEDSQLKEGTEDSQLKEGTATKQSGILTSDIKYTEMNVYVQQEPVQELKVCTVTKESGTLTSDIIIKNAEMNVYVQQEPVQKLKDGTTTKQSGSLTSDLKNTEMNVNVQQSDLKNTEMNVNVQQEPVSGNNIDIKYGVAHVGPAGEHLSVEGTVSHNKDTFLHNQVIKIQPVGRREKGTAVFRHLKGHIQRTTGQDGVFPEVVDLTTDIDNVSSQNGNSNIQQEGCRNIPDVVHTCSVKGLCINFADAHFQDGLKMPPSSSTNKMLLSSSCMLIYACRQITDFSLLSHF